MIYLKFSWNSFQDFISRIEIMGENFKTCKCNNNNILSRRTAQEAERNKKEEEKEVQQVGYTIQGYLYCP